MKKYLWLILSLAAALSVGGILTLRAAENAANPVRWGQRSWANAKARLGLSDDQVTRIKAEVRTEKTALLDLALKARDARVTLRDTIKRTGATEAEVRAAAAALGTAEGDLAVLKARLHARVSPILTAEQLDKIAAWQQKVDDFVDAAIVVFLHRLTD